MAYGSKGGCIPIDYKGKAGTIASKAKMTGVADLGKDTGPSATNSMGKFKNTMLSPGPDVRKHY